MGCLIVSASTAFAGFDDNGDGTITDTDTGLVWEQVTFGPMTWEEALAYCDTLSLGGQDDWRLPTLKELDSITDLGVFDPAINDLYFNDTASDNYWTSTTYDGLRSSAWIMNFTYGDDGTLDKTSTAYVRAVRGGTITPSPSSPYTDNGNGTITDSGTGLVWQKLTVQDELGVPLLMTWEEALSYCDTLILGEQSDWRLPTLKELDSITDLSVYSPAVNTRYFPDTQSNNYWASTTDDGTKSKAWVMNFNSGDDGTLDKASTGYVRAVRGGQMTPRPASRFLDNGNGTVTDRNTGLTWQKEFETAMTWEEALAYCDNLDLVGREDWRLPTLKELDSIIDLAVYSPAIDTRFFPGTLSEDYWSGTTYDGDRTKAWVMNFNYGDDGTLLKTEEAYVRAVLDGEAGTPGELHHFYVSNVSGTQTVGDPFEITIRAVDVYNQTVTSFNGEVGLTSNVGAVNPTRVRLDNGQRTLSVKVYSPSESMRLNCNWSVSYGYSNYFKVSGETACTGSIRGSVIDCTDAAVSDATVGLYRPKSPESDPEFSTNTDDSGKFRFETVPCGEYEIRVQKDGEGTSRIMKKVGDTYCTTAFNIVIPLNCGTKDTPVVVIPGFPGSTIWNSIIVPRLPSEKPAPASDLHIIAPELIGFSHLIVKLISLGYHVVECPWDWRLKCSQVYKEYLRYKIDEALKTSKTGKVHIVAYSMGGLVARSYIQSEEYLGDVDKVAFVGTPHKGSCNPYYMWEGGDPKTADEITDIWFTEALNLYTRSTKALWNKMRPMVWNEKNHNAIRKFLREEVPALRELMYTGDFLTDLLSPEWGVETKGNENTMPIRLTQVPGFVLWCYPTSVRFPSASVGVSASFP